MRLQSKTAVVTGAGSGIGKATAERLASEGARVVVLDRDGDAAKATASQLGGDHLAVVCDLASVDDIHAAANTVKSLLGSIDALINNAGVRAFGPIQENTVEDWDTVYKVNLRGVGLASAKFAPLINDGGSIVNLSSVNAVVGRPGMGIYDATKAGVASLTRTLAAELAERGIRVNAVLPGGTVTEFHLRRAEAAGTPMDIEKITQPHEGGPGLMKRRALPSEIAATIAFLVSDDASFVTGSLLMVDGGLSAAYQRL